MSLTILFILQLTKYLFSVHYALDTEISFEKIINNKYIKHIFSSIEKFNGELGQKTKTKKYNILNIVMGMYKVLCDRTDKEDHVIIGGQDMLPRRSNF